MGCTLAQPTKMVELSVFSGPAKTAEMIEMPFGMKTCVGPRKHVLSGVHTGATWQIPSNRPCAAVVRPVVKLLWPLIIKPHRSTMYVDAAYCYRPNSVVCRSVTLVSPVKMAAPFEMPFGLRTLVGPRNDVLDAGPDPPWKEAILREKRGIPL